MKIELDKSFTDLFPDAIVGIVHGRAVSVRPEFQALLSEFRNRALSSLNQKLGGQGEGQHDHIEAWRDAYRVFGINPKKHRPTHESLARRLLRDGHWPAINPIVDLYLANQADCILPHGGYDCAKVCWPIRLTRSPGNEVFEPLGGGQELTEAGEVIYRDSNRVLTRRWNCRDCDATKITENTSEFVLMIESPSTRIPQVAVEAASASLAEKFRMAFNGEFFCALLRSRDTNTNPPIAPNEPEILTQ